MTLYDSSQLLNIINSANAYFSSLYPVGVCNTNSSNSFGFNDISAINFSANAKMFNNLDGFEKRFPDLFKNTAIKSSSVTLPSALSGNSSFRGNLSLTGTTPSCSEAVRLAEAEYSRGVREIGSSNDSIDIRKYKNGAQNNQQWCGYFTSWLYGAGQGTNNSSTFGFSGSTQTIKQRALNAGCYAYKNSGYVPKVGDLAMWTKSASTGHIGIVTKVYSDGSFDVIEGNSGNKVAKHHYASQDSVGRTFNGFVKMNEWTA